MNKKSKGGRPPKEDRSTIKNERFSCLLTKKQVDDIGGREEVYKFIYKAIEAEALKRSKKKNNSGSVTSAGSSHNV